MTIKIQKEDQIFIWVSIEEVNVYSESKNVIEHTGEYICYLKHTETSPYIVFGEPLKDENKKLLIFKSKQEAINYVKKITTKKQEK